MMNGPKRHSLYAQILCVIFAILFFTPFYYIIINSFKTLQQIYIDPSTWPTSISFENFIKGSRAIKFPKLLWNSFVVTLFSIVAINFFGSLAAWKMARKANRKLFKSMYLLYILSMIIPFQTVMIPVVVITSKLGLMNTRFGLIFQNIGFGLPLTVFLYHGFIGTVPKALEESARIDGASENQVFFSIVFPLLKPITTTIAILNLLWIWNDYLLPSLILHKTAVQTVPIGINKFFDLYDQQWDKALSVLLMSILPIIVIFLILQKYFIAGITSGAVKG